MSENESNLVRKFLIKHNLPVDYKIQDVDVFYNKFFLDKKSANNKIKFILAKGLGGHTVRDDIDATVLKKVLAIFIEV